MKLLIIFVLLFVTVSSTNNPSSTPTRVPTGVPTDLPTFLPTGNPSKNPTNSPIEISTGKPTISPSVEPTISPSVEPTISPSVEPTISPSEVPTSNPTRTPSSTPTNNPIVNTLKPSVTPTSTPTNDPSIAPTNNPSIVPTSTPSLTPTNSPNISTLNPSVTPTNTPTSSPNVAPHSSSPSNSPTNSPSFSPTNGPTNTPSSSPTTKPTNNPSSTPTNEPTNSPNAAPISESPSVTPSISPITSPSTSPTQFPTTLFPTSNPTLQPQVPTTFPTHVPSISPTNVPSESPTTSSPSTSPTTSSPSISPTNTPSTSPITSSPSLNPTTSSPSLNPTTLSPSTNPTTLSPSTNPTTVSPTHDPTFPTLSPTLNPIKFQVSLGIVVRFINATFNKTIHQTPTFFNYMRDELKEAFGENQVIIDRVYKGSVIVQATILGIESPPSSAEEKLAKQFSESDPFNLGEPTIDFKIPPESCIPDKVEDLDSFTISAYAISGVGTLMGIIGGIFVYVNREVPVIKISQRGFLFVFSIGIAILNGSMFFKINGIHSPSSLNCQAHSIFFYLSLTLIIGCLCIKEWRAYMVFKSSQNYKQIKLKNNTLFGYVSVILVIMGVLMGVWMGVSPPKPNPCDEYRCESDGIIVYLVYAFGLILTIATVIVAILARNVPSIGGESQGILISISFVLFAFVLVGLIVVAPGISLTIETWLLAFSVFWCSTIAMTLILFRKALWFSDSIETVKSKFLKTGSSTSGSGGEYNHQHYPQYNNNHHHQYGTNDSDHNCYDVEKNTNDRPISTASSSSAKSSTSFDEAVMMGSGPAPSLARVAEESEQANNNMFTSSIGLTVIPTKEEKVNVPTTNEEINNLEKRIESLKMNGFLIGKTGDWEEYVERKTGDSFWINEITKQVAHSDPTLDSMNVT